MYLLLLYVCHGANISHRLFESFMRASSRAEQEGKKMALMQMQDASVPELSYRLLWIGFFFSFFLFFLFFSTVRKVGGRGEGEGGGMDFVKGKGRRMFGPRKGFPFLAFVPSGFGVPQNRLQVSYLIAIDRECRPRV